MERETGDKEFGLWLLGDSEPARWKDKIILPFEDRHPIRHNIWTSIIDKIQDKLYRYNKTRIDAQRIFIRNAVDDPKIKPKANNTDWKDSVALNNNLFEYKDLIKKFKPKIILSFGSFAFEFGRRCFSETPIRSINFWGAKELGREFNIRINEDKQIKLLPLLHRSIAGGKFIESHEYFCGYKNANYFVYIAESIFHEIKNNEKIMIK